MLTYIIVLTVTLVLTYAVELTYYSLSELGDTHIHIQTEIHTVTFDSS